MDFWRNPVPNLFPTEALFRFSMLCMIEIMQAAKEKKQNKDCINVLQIASAIIGKTTEQVPDRGGKKKLNGLNIGGIKCYIVII